MTKSILNLGLVAAALTALAAPAFAAEPKVLGSQGDWTAFGGDDPKECWAVSPPKSTRNTDAEGNPRERVKVVEREEMVSVSREGVAEPVSSPV